MIDTNYGEGVDPYEQEMLSHEFDSERTLKFRSYDTVEQAYCPFITDHLDRELYPHIDVQQWTGLLSKDGVEIYEGDILSVAHQKYLSAGDERFYKNGYDNRVVKWRVTSHHNGWNIYNAPQTQFEVIGNIHENPELLNQVTEANQ